MKNIILIGGGEIGKGETLEIDSEIKKLAQKGSTFVFFGTAASDADSYIAIIKEVYGNYFKVITASTDKGKKFSEEAIRNASIIYLGGGSTELLMKHFEEWNLIPLIREAIDRGAVVIGMSAGAQALSNCYAQEKDNSIEIRKGWNMLGITACILVHSTKRKFEEVKIFCNQNGFSGNLYGIGESTALWVKDDNKLPERLGTGNIYKYP